MLVAAAWSTACNSSSGPAPAEISVEGTYPGHWAFLLVDQGMYVDPPDVPPGTEIVHGEIICPSEFRVLRQEGNRGSGTFHVMVPEEPQCTSQTPGFCTLPGVQSFCRDVSGTWSGTISRGLGPNSAAADFRFQLDDGDSPTVEALTGCRIIARRAAGAGDQAYADFFGSLLIGSMLETTIDCPAATGFGTVDLGVEIQGVRTAADAARPLGRIAAQVGGRRVRVCDS
jgi:hypothetical protein